MWNFKRFPFTVRCLRFFLSFFHFCLCILHCSVRLRLFYHLLPIYFLLSIQLHFSFFCVHIPDKLCSLWCTLYTYNWIVEIFFKWIEHQKYGISEILFIGAWALSTYVPYKVFFYRAGAKRTLLLSWGFVANKKNREILSTLLFRLRLLLLLSLDLCCKQNPLSGYYALLGT